MQRVYYSEEYLSGILIVAISDGKALKKVLLNSALPSDLQAVISHRKDSVLSETFKQLNEYFSDDRKDFSLPLNPDGTAFQKFVWA